MLKEYDNSVFINLVRKYIDKEDHVLELGSGAGIDLDTLAKDYHVTGSDNSKEFKRLYERVGDQNEFIEIDAKHFTTTETYDVIFSNKVLIHFTKAEIKTSLKSQFKALKPNGIVFHSFWRGNATENFNGLDFHYYDSDVLTELFDEMFEVMSVDYYSEEKGNDSIFIVAKKV
jgi:cyclopropane fatty-acyl-phospholipid synthase-like methyltransferase